MIINFIWIGNYFWQKGNIIVGGIILSLSIIMIIPGIIGFNNMNNHSQIPAKVTIQLSVGMLLMASYLIKNYQGFPFFVSFIGFAIYLFSIDIYRVLANYEIRQEDYKNIRRITQAFGILMMSVAWKLENQTQIMIIHDYSFWLYFWGLTSFWVSLTLEDSNTKVGKLIYGLINLGLIFMGNHIDRSIFLLYGLIGITNLKVQLFFSNTQIEERLFLNFLTICLAFWLQENQNYHFMVIDIPFWLQIFAVSAIWFDIANNVKNEVIELCFHASFIGLSFYLNRFIFLILGSIGLLITFFAISSKYFDDSLMFGGFLIFGGLGLMYSMSYIQDNFTF